MICVIDNYDSFVYNLVQYIGEMGEEVVVYRNDKVSVDEISDLSPSAIVLSPGPLTPKEAGISVELIKSLGKEIPILGVCLGHQSIAVAFGGKVIRADKVVHGKISLIYHDGKTLFGGLENPFSATRYHSLVVERESLPDCFEISAWTDEGTIMGLRHKEFRIEGVQFHPESILTKSGRKLLSNFFSEQGTVKIQIPYK